MSKGQGFDNYAMTNQPSLPGYGPPLGSEQPPMHEQPPAYSQQPAQQQYGLEGWRACGYDTSNVSQTQFTAPVFVPVAPPPRETGPAPDTSASLIMSVLAAIFCLPTIYMAVAAIIYNRKAHKLVGMGQYTAARKALKTVNYLLLATVLLGILSWGLAGYRIYTIVESVD